MPNPGNINILVSVQNKASQPLRQVRKDVTDFRDELVKFNRRLFTASALLATFTMGFRKAFQLAAVGADFDMFRQQFNKTFGSDYFKVLRDASQYTMDSMSIMKLAIQNHARGLTKYEQQRIFTLSVGAAKLLGTSTADAAQKMSQAFQTMSASGLKQFMVALNINNQYKNMELMINKLTKGWNAAGKSSENFRKFALRELEIALGELSMQAGDAKTMFMVLGAGMDSFRQTVGNFLARALAPAASKLGRFIWDIVDKLRQKLDATGKAANVLRQNLINFIQTVGGVISAGTVFLGVFSMMGLIASTLGVSIGSIVGSMTLFGIALKHVKDHSKGWLDALANIGAELKAYYQAFTSFKDGWITLSGTVVDKLKMLDRETQTRIWRMIEVVVVLRKTWSGFVDGIKAGFAPLLWIFDKIKAMLGSGKATGFGSKTLDKWQTAGKVAGVGMVGLIGLFTALKGFKGLFSVLGKIPIVGKLFRGRQPTGSMFDPIYTKIVNFPGLAMGAAGSIGAKGMSWIGGLMGQLGRFLISPPVLATIAAIALPLVAYYMFDKLGLHDKMANWLTSKTQGEEQRIATGNVRTGDQAKKEYYRMLRQTGSSWEDSDQQRRFQNLLVETNSMGFKQGVIDVDRLVQAMNDNKVTSKEGSQLISDTIKLMIAAGWKPRLENGKPNARN